MRELLVQVLSNLRANKLRSILTMFGILWGVVSVVVLGAASEGLQRGNTKALMELGRNIAIVRGGQTSMQAGGTRAGRRIHLTIDDARALARSPGIAVVSPEIGRDGMRIKSAYNAASLQVSGIEPQFQEIRTLDVAHGRTLHAGDEAAARRVAVVGDSAAVQLFAGRNAIGETLYVNGLPYTVIGRIRKKQQDSSYDGQDNDKLFIPFSAMARDFPLPDREPGVLSDIIVTPVPRVLAMNSVAMDTRTGRVDEVVWPLEHEIQRVLAARHGFDPGDPDALGVWDTSLESLMMSRMIDSMKTFFLVVGIVTLALGGLGVMNIMVVTVRERTPEIGLRKALGATTASVQRQFFLEGFLITILSGAVGMLIAIGLAALVNQLPMPPRFGGLLVTWKDGLLAIAMLVLTGVVTSTYPARRAAMLPPV